MPSLRSPTPLRNYTDGQSEVKIEGGTVGEAMKNLLELYPNLKPHILNLDGQLRPFVNLFLNEDNIKDLHGLDTLLQENDRLMIIPSIAGGRNKKVESFLTRGASRG